MTDSGRPDNLTHDQLRSECGRLSRRARWLIDRSRTATAGRPQELIRLGAEIEQHAREGIAFLEGHREGLIAAGFSRAEIDAQTQEMKETWLG